MYSLNEKVLMCDGKEIIVYGVTYRYDVFDVLDSKNAAERLVSELNSIKLPPEKLYSFLADFVDAYTDR